MMDSHYRITMTLGHAGVYATYAAEDLRTGPPYKIVVIKAISREVVANDGLHNALTSAIQATKALNHPNIIRTQRLEISGSELHVVREYEQGEALASILARGRLSLGEVIHIITQLARTLDVVHKCRLVHRNLKTTNVFLSRKENGNWVAKIADFSIRHLIEPDGTFAVSGSHVCLAYTSPEELLHAAVDHRSDIWSLGVLFYEMLTGINPFRSSNSTAEILSILKDTPDPVSRLHPDYTETIDRILDRCLSKNPELRYQSAYELVTGLELLSGDMSGAPGSSANRPTAENASTEKAESEPKAGNPRRVRKLASVVVALVSLLAVWIAARGYYSPGPVTSQVRKFTLSPAHYATTGSQPAISPDGRSIAYLAGKDTRSVWVQELSEDEPRELGNTVDASNLFWSPDSEWVGFLTRGEVRRVSLRDGTVATVCAVPDESAPFSASWSPDGYSIAFNAGTPGRLFRVAASGGQPEVILQADGGVPEPTFVQYLPSVSGRPSVVLTGPDSVGDVYLYDIEVKARKSLGIAAGYGIYSPTGHLLLGETRSVPSPLRAVEFSLETMEPTGQPFQVRERVAWPSVSGDGVLVYADAGGPWVSRLVWRSRHGNVIDSSGMQWSSVRQVVLSPNGRKIAIIGKRLPGASDALWLGGSSDPEWAFETISGNLQSGVLSYTGDRGLVTTEIDGSAAIHLRRSDDRGVTPIRADDSNCEVTDWSADGRHILCSKTHNDGTADLWRLTYDLSLGQYRKVAILETASDERGGVLSPDRRWLAYCSNRSGKHEVYVTAFPQGGESARISDEGGTQVRWGQDAHELFYVNERTLISVTLEFTAGPRIVERRPLFSDPGLAAEPKSSERHYDYDRAEDNFLVVSRDLAEDGLAATIRLTENWTQEIRRQQNN